MKTAYVNSISEEPKVAERIYRGILKTGFSTTGSLDVDQVFDVLNSFLKSHITCNHHVKTHANNVVTDEVMVVAKPGVHVNDYIVGSIEKVKEQYCSML